MLSSIRLHHCSKGPLTIWQNTGTTGLKTRRYHSASSSSDFLNVDHGDLLIRGFWEGSTDTIIDVHVTKLDSKSCRNLPPKKALERQEKEKK